jgi:hypothetical protein
MREAIARYRDLLVARLNVLEEEIRVAEALCKERHGDFRYVTLENVALFELQLQRIHRLKAQFEAMDLERFSTIDEFKETVLAALRELYDARPMLRCALRMVMECVRDL